jgi:hypothetical protein
MLTVLIISNLIMNFIKSFTLIMNSTNIENEILKLRFPSFSLLRDSDSGSQFLFKSAKKEAVGVVPFMLGQKELVGVDVVGVMSFILAQKELRG